MTIPDFQSLVRPVLEKSAQGEIKTSEVVEALAKELDLSQEDSAQLLPSGRQTTFANRVHWAKSYLNMGGLIENTRRGHFRITSRGSDVLKTGPTRIDIQFLTRFPEFVTRREGRDPQAAPGAASRKAIFPFSRPTKLSGRLRRASKLHWVKSCWRGLLSQRRPSLKVLSCAY